MSTPDKPLPSLNLSFGLSLRNETFLFMLIRNYDFHWIFVSSFSPTETTLTEIGSGSFTCHGQGLLHSTMSTDPLCRLLSYTKELSLSKPIGLSRKGGWREERRPLLWDFINSPVTSIRVNYVGRTWRKTLGMESWVLGVICLAWAWVGRRCSAR